MPQMEGICGGGLIFPPEANLPKRRGFEAKRLMGFEPTTFCMASRRSSQLSYSRIERDYRRAAWDHSVRGFWGETLGIVLLSFG
jgi:hypothetical protein